MDVRVKRVGQVDIVNLGGYKVYIGIVEELDGKVSGLDNEGIDTQLIYDAYDGEGDTVEQLEFHRVEIEGEVVYYKEEFEVGSMGTGYLIDVRGKELVGDKWHRVMEEVEDEIRDMKE